MIGTEMKFLVIFPVLRGIDALNASLGSVLLQTGNFDLHVHVQSADTTDDTKTIVSKWQDWLKGNNPSERKRLTISQEPDAGLYDGVTRGFEVINPDDNWIMTWLGSDDVLIPNSLATVQSVLAQLPHIKWITGQCFVSGPDGANCSPHPWNNYEGKTWRMDGMTGDRHPSLCKKALSGPLISGERPAE